MTKIGKFHQNVIKSVNSTIYLARDQRIEGPHGRKVKKRVPMAEKSKKVSQWQKRCPNGRKVQKRVSPWQKSAEKGVPMAEKGVPMAEKGSHG